jgi:hypothetical protein
MPKHRHWSEISCNSNLRNLLGMELFDSLFDDERLVRHLHTPLASALADHLRLCETYRSRLATLVVPDRFLAEVARQVPDGVSLPVSVITSGGAGGLLGLARRTLPGVDILSAEPALRDLNDLAGSAARVVSAAAELGSDIAIFVELPYAPGWQAAVELVEAAGLYGKLAAEHAEPRRTAEQLSILIEADLPFKITTGSSDRGLAVLAATEVLINGASLDDAAELIQSADNDQIKPVVSAWGPATQSRIRRRIRRLGSHRLVDLINDDAVAG